MKEGWRDDAYFILFCDIELQTMSEKYSIANMLPDCASSIISLGSLWISTQVLFDGGTAKYRDLTVKQPHS